jgi:hypothetical protein
MFFIPDFIKGRCPLTLGDTGADFRLNALTGSTFKLGSGLGSLNLLTLLGES